MTQIDQSLLENLPFGLLLLDPEGRAIWLNGAMQDMLHLPASEVIGKSGAQLPKTVQQLLGAESRLIRLGDSGGWVNRELRRGEDGQRLLVAQDVTAAEDLAADNARLRQQVEDLKLTDDLTGLPNKRAISQALDLHISRSRRYKNPLSTALVHVDLQPLDEVQAPSDDPALLAVSRFLRDRLRWVDQIARWEEHVFLLVLPETTEPDARKLLLQVVGEQQGMVMPESYGDLRPKLTFGLACWTKGNDMRTLLRQTLADLQQNSAA